MFTNAEGRYRIDLSFHGELTVRARASAFADQVQEVSIGGDEQHTLNLEGRPLRVGDGSLERTVRVRALDDAPVGGRRRAVSRSSRNATTAIRSAIR